MNVVTKLSLRGQINAIYFFGVDHAKIRDWRIDFMDDLRLIASNINLGSIVNYKGRKIPD